MSEIIFMPKYVGRICVLLILQISLTISVHSQDGKSFFKDRGTGIPTSMWGTYINKGEIAIEGNQDELSLINDLQFHLEPWMFIRVNNGIGLTSKATDYAPELGVVFYLNKK